VEERNAFCPSAASDLTSSTLRRLWAEYSDSGNFSLKDISHRNDQTRRGLDSSKTEGRETQKRRKIDKEGVARAQSRLSKKKEGQEGCLINCGKKRGAYNLREKK